MFGCKRCGHECKTKANLISHLKRKNVCDPEFEDISQEALIEELCKKDYNEVTFDCQFCNKKFNSYKNKWRHTKICPKAPDKDEGKVVPLKQYNELKEKLEKALVKSSGNVTINNVNNVNNNINTGTQVINKLRNFGNENMEAVPNHFIRSSVMNLEYATLFENLHCDPEYPENHNIRIKSKKDKELEMFTQDKWKIKSFKKGLSEVMDHLNRIYEDFCRDNFDDLIEDVGEEDAEATLKDVEEKTKITADVHKEILNTLEEYRPMLTKAIGMVSQENLQLT